MEFLEKQQTLRKIQEVNPGLIGLLTEEEIEEIFQALQKGASIEELVGTAEKATFRAAASSEEEDSETPPAAEPKEASVASSAEEAAAESDQPAAE